MGVKLKFNDLKVSSFEQITTEGIYILEFEDLIQGVNQKGDTKYEMSHKIVNTNIKINYDNYTLYTAKDEILAFGTSKLRKLIEATGLVIEEINPKLLKTLLTKKRFKAYIVLSEKGYPQIRYTDIFPLSYEVPALNEFSEDPTPSSPTEQGEQEEATLTQTDIIDTTDI